MNPTTQIKDVKIENILRGCLKSLFLELDLPASKIHSFDCAICKSLIYRFLH
jgi:hypothetical protein